VDVTRLKDQWERGLADPVCVSIITVTSLLNVVVVFQNDKVSQYMTKFKRSASHPYALITPASPLADLEDFLKTNIFALGYSYLLCIS
jgi:hypothetical protein